MVERSLSMREVPGSIPGFSISFTFMIVNLFSTVPNQSWILLFLLFSLICLHVDLYCECSVCLLRNHSSGLIVSGCGDDTIRIFQEVGWGVLGRRRYYISLTFTVFPVQAPSVDPNQPNFELIWEESKVLALVPIYGSPRHIIPSTFHWDALNITHFFATVVRMRFYFGT